jgi:DNA-directed RNA polymerase specialized sigma24 family protein
MSDFWDTFNDPAFVERLKSKENEAWTELIAKATPELRRIVRSVGIKDTDLVKNCVNAGISSIFIFIEKYDMNVGKLRNWVITIVFNEARRELGQELRQLGGTVSDTISERGQQPEAAVSPDFANIVELKEPLSLLDPFDQRVMIDAIDEVDYDVIALRDGISEAVARKRRSRARIRYLQILEGGGIS